MILTSLVLAAVTLYPATSPGQTPNVGVVDAQAVSPDATCKPNAICAMLKLTGKFNNCFFTNVDNGATGGTPLTLDATLTGPQGSPVYLYWVNATSMNITLNGGKTRGMYRCV